MMSVLIGTGVARWRHITHISVQFYWSSVFPIGISQQSVQIIYSKVKFSAPDSDPNDTFLRKGLD